MRKKPIHTYNALFHRFLALFIALWVGCMGILTCCVAADMVIQLDHQLTRFVQSASSRESRDDTSLPGTLAMNMVARVGWPYYFLNIEPLFPVVGDQHLTDGVSSDDWLWGKWELYYGYEAAVIYYDEQDEILVGTGDYLTFSYTTAERWREEDTVAVGYGFVAL